MDGSAGDTKEARWLGSNCDGWNAKGESGVIALRVRMIKRGQWKESEPVGRLHNCDGWNTRQMGSFTGYLVTYLFGIWTRKTSFCHQDYRGSIGI